MAKNGKASSAGGAISGIMDAGHGASPDELLDRRPSGSLRKHFLDESRNGTLTSWGRMSRKPFQHVRRAAPEPAPDFPPLASYRSTVVELPWPDFLGRRVLLAIDARGRILNQGTAVDESEAQRVTDTMMGQIEAEREYRQRMKDPTYSVVPLFAPASTLGAS